MDPLPAPHPSRVFRVDGNCEFSWFFSCKGILRRIERIENIIVVSKHGYFLSAILLRIPWASRLPGGEGVLLSKLPIFWLLVGMTPAGVWCHVSPPCACADVTNRTCTLRQQPHMCVIRCTCVMTDVHGFLPYGCLGKCFSLISTEFQSFSFM